LSRQGKLLIAHPNLPKNTPFYKSVVYVLNDDEHGTQGIIVNKPAGYRVNDFIASKGVDYFPQTSEKMRFGGPLSTKMVFMLHTDDFESQSSSICGPGLMVSCDDFMIEKMSMGQMPYYWRMAIGICGWQPGQLDMELKGQRPYKSENSWLTANADEGIIFNYDGEEQWKKAMELSSFQMINQFF
jgi:putative transcriptional regulator